MKVIVARSDAKKNDVWLQPYSEDEFAYDQQTYDLRKKYAPEGVDPVEFAERYKNQTPAERAEEFAAEIVTDQGKYNLESVVITEIDSDDYKEYTVKFFSYVSFRVETVTVDNLHNLVIKSKAGETNIINDIVYEQFEIHGDRVLTVSDGKSILYDKTEWNKQELQDELGFDRV